MSLLINLTLVSLSLLNFQVFFIEYHILIYLFLFIAPVIVIFSLNLITQSAIGLNFFWSINPQLSYFIILEFILYVVSFFNIDFSMFILFSFFWET